MATARDLIRTNVGAQSGLIFDANFEGSYFTPKAWAKSTNYSTQKQELKPVNQITDAYGATVEFRPPKTFDYLGFASLQIPFSAVTPGTGYSYSRFVDYLGVHAVNKIEISHVSNIIARLDMNVYLPRYLLHSDRRRRELWDPLLLGNLSTTTRSILSTGGQVALIPLDGFFWFTYGTNCFTPIIILSNELRFEVTFNPLSAVFQSDHTGGTPTGTISTQTVRGQSHPLALVFTSVHVTGDERSFQTDVYERDGIMQAFKEFKQQPRVTVIPSTSGVVPVRLTSIKDQISEIYWVARRSTDVNTPWGNEPNRRLSYVSVSFTGNGGEMIPTHTKQFIDRRQREHFHSSYTGESQNIGFLPLCWIPEDPINNTGSIHVGIISDPTLNLDVGTTAGQSEIYDALNGTSLDGSSPDSVVIDVFVDAFNWLHFVGGDVYRTFN
jgi:hypothetical protein